MATAALSNIKRAPVGDRTHVRAKVTESGSYSSGGTSITAAALGLRYIEALYVSPPNAAGIHVAWDQSVGTSTKVVTYDEDNISGIEAEISGTVSTVYSILAIGF